MRYLLLLIMLLGTWGSTGAMAQPSQANWEDYQRRFITPEGRVVDTGNQDVSHSEGQGWGMILAVAHDDADTFERLWRWTRSQLARDDMRLFAWRYDPYDRPQVSDLNNASDGDLFIAWALHLASERWEDQNYAVASTAIRQEIKNRLVRRLAGYTVLLPGLSGFVGSEYIDINLSYWFMPALLDFAELDPEGPWQALIDDGIRLLEDGRFGQHRLPTDWMRLQSNGIIEPSPDFPPRFSFDAVRIPLYFHWGNLSDEAGLESILAFWNGDRARPAWIDVMTGERANYARSRGVQAIAELFQDIETGHYRTVHGLRADDDYYAASLILLSHQARREQPRFEGRP